MVQSFIVVLIVAGMVMYTLYPAIAGEHEAGEKRHSVYTPRGLYDYERLLVQ